MAINTTGQQLNDLLITRNFDPEALDAATGKPSIDNQGAPAPQNADMFKFDWVARSGKNYGTVVCLLGDDDNLEVYFGDNLGRGMDPEDKNDWYGFLEQLSNFAKRNRKFFNPKDLSKLKYTMAGIAAIKEGLFEGYYGNRKISYAGEPTEARLMIKHNRTLGENDARYRYVESLFIETAEGERFKLPFRKLAGGRAMLEHVRKGGTPYDIRGQHITEMVEQINVLAQFRRAHQGRVFEGAAGDLISETDQYYRQLQQNLKAISHSRGYQQYFETWTPADITETDLIVEDLKTLFVETRIDPRIEQALPMLAKIQKEAQQMKEAEIFESWASRLVEGTWSLPETPEQQEELKTLMSQPLTAGADGMNATEQLYNLVGDDELFDIISDIASTDPDANVWDDKRVQNRLEQLGVFMVTPAEPAVDNAEPPAEEPNQEVKESDWGEELARLAMRVNPNALVRHNGKVLQEPPKREEPKREPEDIGALEQRLSALEKKYQELGGDSWKYADTMMPRDQEARDVYNNIQHLATRIAQAKKHQGMVEGDNLSTFEGSGCNHTMEGEYCPEHGLSECGNYGVYEDQLSRIKSLALSK